VDQAPDEDVDEVGLRTVLDQDDVDYVATLDFSPGSDTEQGSDSARRKLLEFAQRAEGIVTAKDELWITLPCSL
jgi:RNA polymerase-interacting CarD/CdnL/TRCF family regulator